MNIKFTSGSDKKKLDMLKKEEVPTMKNKYRKQIMRNKAPNCVQKNIR